MKYVIRYFLIFLLYISISLFSKIRHIYESDGAQAIQDTIDISGLWDSIIVHNGKYHVGDIINQWGIQLRGCQLMSVAPDSAPFCTLTAVSSSGLDTAFHVIWDTLGPQEWARIQGFTIIGGKGLDSIVETGGGIYIKNWDEYYDLELNIQDNIITKNYEGIVIEHSFGPVKVQRNHIVNNRGAGIVSWASSPTIKNNVIENNINYGGLGSYRGYGGGIYVESGYSASFFKNCNKKAVFNTTIEDNLILNNYAKNFGGGICCGYAVDVYLRENTIAFNIAGIGGGGLKTGGDWSTTWGENNIFIANIANEGGAIEAFWPDTNLNYNFSVDNASYNDSSGFIYCYGININYSNVYYNTYQKDIEILSLGSTSFKNNFWWVTDSAKVDSLIEGDADFMPFMMGPVPDTPGEPIEIYSVLNYSSDYSSIVDSIGGDPDTLFLEITGHDNKHEFQEAAIAILKSKIYPAGIAVALLETDKSTGIYRGKAIVKTTNPPDSIRIDDMYQIIRVHPVADTIRVYANMDTTEMFKVFYRCQSGVEEESLNEFILEPVHGLTSLNPEFRFYLPEGCEVELSIYDICGRLVDEVLSTRLSSGWHTIEGEIEKAGVYIYQMKTAFGDRSGKIVAVR